MSLKDELLSNWLGYAVPPEQAQAKSGTISLYGKISGKEFNPALMKISLKASVDKGALLVINGPYVENISVSANMADSAAEISAMTFDVYGGKGVIKGKASDLFGKPQFDGVFSLSEIKGGQINSDVLSGDLRAAVNFKGMKPD